MFLGAVYRKIMLGKPCLIERVVCNATYPCIPYVLQTTKASIYFFGVQIAQSRRGSLPTNTRYDTIPNTTTRLSINSPCCTDSNMSAKRAACDRCHKMKMQCKTDGSGQQCQRCRAANANCHYSEPGKPGRPASMGTNQAVRLIPEPTTVLESGSCPVDYGADWDPTTFASYGSNENSFSIINDHPGHWAQHIIGHGDLGSTGLYVDMLRQHGPSDWSSTTTASDDSPPSLTPSTTFSTRRPHRESPRDSESGAETMPTKKRGVGWVDGTYTHNLAYFQVKIARMMSFDGRTDPFQLELDAAHVLQSSLEFLELVELPASAARTAKGLQQPSPVDTAIFLQLSSLSMRLTEMHYLLYSSIHCFLQQGGAEPSDKDNMVPRSTMELPLFSIAGVKLAPSPQLRLELILHTAVHHLRCIQGSLKGLEALESVSTGLSMHAHGIISQDQTACLSKIRLVLGKIKHEGGIDVAL